MRKKLSQTARVLAILKQRPLSTLEARNEMFIMSIAARIFELKEDGHNIITRSIKAGNEDIAEYVLLNDEVANG